MMCDAMKNGQKPSKKLAQFALSQILEATEEPVFICDAKKRLVFANYALASRLRGGGRAVGKTVASSFPKQAAKIVGEAINDAMRKGKSRTAHATDWSAAGGSPMWVSFSVKKIPGNHSVLGIGHDETPSRILLFQLYKKIEHLEQFRKLAVGREMRMMELKQENEALRRSIDEGA